jgi:hypothetical protein
VKTGFVSHGSINNTLFAGVTILKPAWPYQVSCVCAMVSQKRKQAVEQNIFLNE